MALISYACFVGSSVPPVNVKNALKPLIPRIFNYHLLLIVIKTMPSDTTSALFFLFFIEISHDFIVS